MLLLLSTIHVIVCLFLILVVLLQQGKGADLSVFGGGGTQAAFGARSATSFLHKLTVVAFVGFILTTMAIGLLKTNARSSSVITDLPVDAATAADDAEPATAVDEVAAAAEATDAATTTDADGDTVETAVDSAAASAEETATANGTEGGSSDNQEE